VKDEKVSNIYKLSQVLIWLCFGQVVW